MQSQRLSAIMGTTSAHARRRYVKNADMEHVVVCGNLDSGMTDFFREVGAFSFFYYVHSNNSHHAQTSFDWDHLHT
jgi:hypothetical protein